MTTTTFATTWPTRLEDQATRIVHSMRTDNYIFEYTEDRILTISLNDDAPASPFLAATKGQPNYTVLNQEDIAALTRFLASIEA